MAKASVKAKAKVVAQTKTIKKEKLFPFKGIGLLFIISSLCLAFIPDITRSWGLDYIAFFDTWVIVLFYLMLFCFWLPQTNRYIVKILTSISKKRIISLLEKYRYVVFIIIGLIAGYCFYLLKIKYIFLGDFDIQAKKIEQGISEGSERLTMLLLGLAHTFLHGKYGFTGVQTVQLCDYIIGSLFIFTSLCTANLMGDTLLKKIAAFVISTLSLAGLLLFCGYPEMYALPVLCLQIYLLTCLLYLKRKINMLIPTLVVLLGIALHLMLVCLIPSLIFLFYRNVLWKYPFFRNKRNILIIILVSLPFLYVAFNKFALSMMLPLEEGDKHLLTMFSVAHYKEFLNSQLLGSGIGFFIWVAILIYSLIHKIKYDATCWFFLIASLSVVGLMFVFDGVRGSGDWDIFSFAPVVYNMGIAYFLLMAYNEKWYKNIQYGILMIGGFSVLHTSMWLLMNKTDASIPRFESAIETDPANYYRASFNNEALIATALLANGMEDRAIKWNKKSWLKYPDDPRMGYNYANILIKQNRPEEAYSVLEQTVKSSPGYALPYFVLIDHYIESRNYTSLYQILLQMEQIYKQSPDVFTSRASQEQLNQYFDILSSLKSQLR